MLQKIGFPALIGLLLGFAGYSIGVYQVSNRPLEIKQEAPTTILNSIDQRLDDLQKANGIEIEKLKGFKGTFHVSQNYHVSMNGDSLIVKQIVSQIADLQDRLKVVRCR